MRRKKEEDENKTLVEYGTLQNKQSKSPHIHAEPVHYRDLQAQCCIRLVLRTRSRVLLLFRFTLRNVRDCSFSSSSTEGCVWLLASCICSCPTLNLTSFTKERKWMLPVTYYCLLCYISEHCFLLRLYHCLSQCCDLFEIFMIGVLVVLLSTFRKRSV
jgi:hypothetical protein